jgi:DNA-binding GntR family transcriptional regulator
MPLAPRKSPPRRLVTRHRVREAIERMIIDGRCRAGSKLVQEDLAEKLGVARGVVREAILELRGTGLIETIDNRGMFVAPLSVEKLMESFDLREFHDGLAARRACTRINEAQLDDLRERVRRVHGLATAGKTEQAAKLDRAFHRRIIELAGNALLAELGERFAMLGKVMYVRAIDPEETLRSHLAIADALASRDPDRAEHAAREHIRTGRTIIGRMIADGTFKPSWLPPGTSDSGAPQS